MERNLHFETTGLKEITVHLAWAQLEIFADDVEKIQVMAAGDESSVEDLRIVIRDGALLVEQPQYGLSLKIMESHWMQVCIRVPRTWGQVISVSTISSLLSARGLSASRMVLDTVSGDLRATRLSAKELTLKTISGEIRGETLKANALSARSVSGNISLDGMETETLKGNSVSGDQTYALSRAFQRMDINAVSGQVIIASPHDSLNAALRSISGQIRTKGVNVTEEEGDPKVRVNGVSTDLKLIYVKE